MDINLKKDILSFQKTQKEKPIEQKEAEFETFAKKVARRQNDYVVMMKALKQIRGK